MRKINLAFFITIVFYIASSVLLGWTLRNVDIPIYISLLLSQLLILLPTGIYLKITHTRVREHIPHRPLRPAVVVLLVIFALLLEPLMVVLNSISLFFTESGTAGLTSSVSDLPFWSNLLMIALVPAVSEEFIFRGIYYHEYRRSNVLKAILLSAFLFGLMHLNLNQFVYTFFLGIVLAVMVEATGSIFASMVIHFTINGFSVVMLEAVKWLSDSSAYQESLNQVSAATVENASTLGFAIAVWGFIAIFTTAGAMLIAVAITRLSGRKGYIKWLLFGEGRKIEGIKKTGVMSLALCLAIVIAAAYMVWASW